MTAYNVHIDIRVEMDTEEQWTDDEVALKAWSELRHPDRAFAYIFMVAPNPNDVVPDEVPVPLFATDIELFEKEHRHGD